LRYTFAKDKAMLQLKGRDLFNTMNPKTKVRNGAQHLDMNTNMDFPLERSLEDCLKAVEVKSLSRYFDDQLDAAEELYGIQLHFNFNTNDVKVLIDSYRIAYSQEICDRCEALIRRQMLHYGYLVR
jgi:hypothetical protein